MKTDFDDLLDRVIDHPRRDDPPVDLRDRVLRQIANETTKQRTSLPWLSLVIATLAGFCFFAEPLLRRFAVEESGGLLDLVLDWSVECGLVLLVVLGLRLVIACWRSLRGRPASR